MLPDYHHTLFETFSEGPEGVAYQTCIRVNDTRAEIQKMIHYGLQLNVQWNLN